MAMKFAHFESGNSIECLYKQHAEVARKIHEDTLREFTGNNELTVDLIRKNPADGKQETLEKLSEYDSVSCSQVGYTFSHDIKYMRDFFDTHEMPVYTVCAGNNGKITALEEEETPAEFARNSLIVGEATILKNRSYIESHSSTYNPTLACDSPFNDKTKRYKYINESPSLEGHEDLVQDWLYGQNIIAWDTPKEEINQHIAHYIANPEEIHKHVLKRLDYYDIDENGYISELDGTSFSAPMMAGYLSGALYAQEVREGYGLPTLTKDEITSLVKMSTFEPTRTDDGIFKRFLSPETHTNTAGNTLTDAGGHGIFSPDMFVEMLNAAYDKIENDPDINRDPVEIVITPELDHNKNSAKFIVNHSNTDVMIDKVLTYFEFDTLNGKEEIPHPTEINSLSLNQSMSRHDGSSYTRECPLDMGVYNYDKEKNIGWSRSEYHFGETLKTDEEWTIDLKGFSKEDNVDMKITIYGYESGGLMDQMMEHSKEIAPKYDHNPKTEPDPDLQTTAERITASLNTDAPQTLAISAP